MRSEATSAACQSAGALDKHLVRSLAWTAIVKGGSQIVSWACFLVVTRLIAVSDFGLITMCGAFLGVLGQLGEFGISATVVNLRDLEEEQLRQLNGMSILLGFLALAITAVSAGALAQFFHAPQLTQMLPIMGLGFAFVGFRGVPQGLLQRALRFKLISIIEAVQMWVQAAVTIVLAVLGGGFWALILGTLAGSACAAMLPLFWYRPGFTVPRMGSISRALRFSGTVTISSLSWYAYSSADFAVAGRMLGKDALGAYSMAWTIATLPAEKLASLIMRVMPGFLSNCQTDRDALQRYICRASEAMALVTVTAATGIVLTAHEFIPLVLGERWRPAIAPVILLSVYGAMNSLLVILPQVLNAVGRPSSSMWNAVLKLVCFPPAFWFASRWGAVGIAATWVVLYPLLSIPLVMATFQAVGMPPRRYLRCLAPALSCSVAIVFAVLFVDAALVSEMPEWGRLLVKTVSGLGAMVLVLATVHIDRVRAFRRMFRESRMRA